MSALFNQRTPRYVPSPEESEELRRLRSVGRPPGAYMILDSSGTNVRPEVRFPNRLVAIKVAREMGRKMPSRGPFSVGRELR